MKRFIFFIAVAMTLAISALSPQEAYIMKYSEVAVGEMYRSGVPASITLAQGLIESRYGLSELAVKGNNHFGIKCHDWTGKTMKVDDDRKGECFRVYDNPEDSYRDHSDFLRYRDRYKDLFDLQTTDYKAWAHGLKKAGYATDPLYASKLIEVIERYDLSRFDRGMFEPEPDMEKEDKAATITRPKREKRQGRRRKDIPLPPRVLEEPVAVESDAADEVFHFSTERKLYSVNGVPFVYSEEGESYASIAVDYNLFLGEILRFNDLEMDRELTPGTIVYVKSKKNKAAQGVDKYIVEEDGMSLVEISQRFGVKTKALRKLNGFSSDHTLYEGDTIILR